MWPPRTVQVYFSREWEWVILGSESTLEGRVDTDGDHQPGPAQGVRPHDSRSLPAAETELVPEEVQRGVPVTL